MVFQSGPSGFLTAGLMALVAPAAAMRREESIQAKEIPTQAPVVDDMDHLADYMVAKQNMANSDILQQSSMQKFYFEPVQQEISGLIEELQHEKTALQSALTEGTYEKSEEAKRTMCNVVSKFKKKCDTNKKYNDLMADIDIPAESFQFVSTTKDNPHHPGAYIGLYVRNEVDELGQPVYRGPNYWRLVKRVSGGNCQWVFAHNKHNQFSIDCGSDGSLLALGRTKEWNSWPNDEKYIEIKVLGAFKRESYDFWRQEFEAAEQARCHKAGAECEPLDFETLGTFDRKTDVVQESNTPEQLDCSRKDHSIGIGISLGVSGIQNLTLDGTVHKVFLDERYPLRDECGKCSVLEIEHAQAAGNYTVTKEMNGHPYFQGPSAPYRLWWQEGKWWLAHNKHTYWSTEEDSMDMEMLGTLGTTGEVGIKCVGEYE